MFHSADIKCEVCGHIMMPAPGFDNATEGYDVCIECKKAIEFAKEQRNYQYFFSLQQAIDKALKFGITKRQLADEFECAYSTIDRYIAGTAKPMPGVCKYMINTINKMVT
jgi:DNA-directed RNA polymerase subunit RPC12/RpoP